MMNELIIAVGAALLVCCGGFVYIGWYFDQCQRIQNSQRFTQFQSAKNVKTGIYRSCSDKSKQKSA